MVADPQSQRFVDELERALRHLYNPVELRRSPLLPMLALEHVERPALALQELLIEAIASLRPAMNVPVQASAWRFYHILNQRYVEQFGQQDIADSLALSPRQLRRLHPQALQSLADIIMIRHRPDLGPRPGAFDPDSSVLSRESELERLQQTMPDESVHVAGLAGTVLEMIRPMAESRSIHLAYAAVADPLVAAPSTAIRSALLTVISAIIPHTVAQSTLRVTVQRIENWACICLQALLSQPLQGIRTGQSESLSMARDLISLSGGLLDIEGNGDSDEGNATITIRLPVSRQVSVLLIDDNEDALRLYERYLSGSRYRATGIRDPRQALQTVRETAPDIIVLDLMLPGMDGWELLGHLRAQSETRHVPIIVCTILPQEDLALALGAAALVRKPVSRAAFLAALDHQVDQVARQLP
jgi:CheY-like chemotaxis protein